MCKLLISNADIEEAELAILGAGKHFNESQIAFIKCLDTIDLTACPGSGKTTALVAKLYILAKYEVWKSGDPICVISHTRIAIDEIKDKVASHFPKIMDYPNFIGTIQQFTDKYLAIPYYKSLGFNEIKSIDDEIFANKWKTQNTVTLRYWLMNNRECQTEDDHDKKIASLNYHHNDEIKIAPQELYLSSLASPSYQQAITAKYNLFTSGYLTYADTRNLAAEYIQKHPNITQIIAKRFFYIFLDEAQDTSPEQMHLLETFVKSGCYQRIGDPLQTIFNADSDVKDVWLKRDYTPQLHLMVSNRFGKKIAHLVNYIGGSLDPDHSLSSAIEDSSYQKCIALIFDDKKPEDVIEWFTNYSEQELNFIDNKSLYAIGAVGKFKDDKLTINSYLPSYRSDRKVRSDYFKNPSDYFVDISAQTIRDLGSNVLYTRLMKLFVSEIKEKQGDLSKQDIEELINLESTSFSELVIVIINALNSGKQIPYEYISSVFKSEAAKLFGIEDLVIEFNDNPINTVHIIDDTDPKSSISYSTIHGVKGQTHDATLLLTTQFYTTGKKASEIGGTDLDYLIHNPKTPSVRSIRRKRLLYVASSRARYLFVWAIPRSKREKLSQVEELFSEVVEI